MNKPFEHLSPTWINATVFEHFEEIAMLYPSKIAINDGTHILTYQEVLSYIHIIASKLQSSQSKNEPVLILLENDAYFICVMLACLAVGRGYVPLDAGYAHSRNQKIITHSQAKTIISLTSLAEVYNLDDSYELIEFDSIWPSVSPISYDNNPQNLAYILYTSGSTGQPKGVYQNQQNLLHDVMQYINSVNITSADRMSLLYSPSVNGAIRDIYGALLTGATLYIHNLQKHGVSTIPDFIEKNALTIYHSIPSIFRTGMGCRNLQNFDTVRLIYLAGDKIFKHDIDIYKQEFSATCRVYVGIGSTENATIYRQWFIDKNTDIADGIVPVGYVVDDREMTLVNEDGIVHQVNVLGEIQVKSKYCALGYWKDERLTNQHFILHNDGSRTVKTGDWGLINDEGLLEFKGRRDGQVKINGFRIEIGEIEANIRAVKGVADAAVLVRHQEETSKIVAYLVLEGAISLEDVKLKLANSLATQMFPSFFYLLESMPYLNNFKLDYQGLRALEKENIDRENQAKAPVVPLSTNEPLYLKERLLNLWCQYASYESFKNDLTWKMGGGSSLEAVNFIVKMEQEFGIKFPDEWIHEAMKPTHIEQQIRQLLGSTTALTNTQTDDLVHVYAFPPLKGITPQTREFLRALGNNLPLTLIDYPRFETWEKDDICLEKIANTIDKQLFQKGKLKIFIGHCSGDHLAFYVLNQLSEIYPLENLYFFIIDSWNHHYHFKGLTKYRINHIIKRIRHIGLWKVLKAAFMFRKNRLKNKLQNKGFERASANDYAQEKVILENYPFKSMDVKAHLLISEEHSYSADMGWLYYLPKLTSETFPFKHSEMYKDVENQQVVLEKLLSFIEEAKRNYTSVK